MSRYIDADALTNKNLDISIPQNVGAFEFLDIMEQVLKIIDEEPTIDAVPVVHSAWKHEIEDMGIFRNHTVRCLNCKSGFSYAYVVLLCGDTGDLFMHCPSCGAIMDCADGERRPNNA